MSLNKRRCMFSLSSWVSIPFKKYYSSFVEIKFACYTIYSFKVYNSMVFTILITINFSSSPPHKILYPRGVTPQPPCSLLISHPSQPKATTNLFSVFVDLPINGIIPDRKHTEFSCDWPISLNIMFSRFINGVAYISTSFLFFGYSIPFYCQEIVYGADGWYLIYPCIT